MEVMKHKVCLEPIHKELEVVHNTPLRDVLIDWGVEFPCGGRGFCGNCKVRILSGNIEMSDSHVALLNKKRLNTDWRLACLSRITEDVTIYVEQFQYIIQTDHFFEPSKTIWCGYHIPHFLCFGFWGAGFSSFLAV